jgi:preprotein translocase subunit SecD
MKKKNLLQRFIIIVVVTIVGLYVVIGPHRRPKFSDFSLTGIKNSLRDNIRLGLDLKGGSHLVMRVKVEEYLKRVALDGANAAEKAAKDAGAQVTDFRAETNGGYSFSVTTADASKHSQIEEAVSKKVNVNDWQPTVSGNTITWRLTGSAETRLGQEATEQAYKIIESRINSVGVAEPTLQFHGAQNSHQILLQMPGLQDPQRVKDLLVGESRLDLVHVVSPPNPNLKTYATQEEATADALENGRMPANKLVVPYLDKDEPTTAGSDQADPNAPKTKKWVIVEQPSVVDGSELSRADAVSRTGGSDYQIAFNLKPTGAEKFGAWTGANVGQYMGVMLNGEIKSIAFIKSQITDSGEISGRFTKQSADDLALTLRSGALPAPIEYQEERTVGPSLGQDSIRAGVEASLVGLGLVIAFMLFYYRGSGINAVVALILNMILMMAALVAIKATLTLPGIAGIILTIGMAVDSNVLIFERIREELRTGKTVPSAVEQGFARAFVTIIDTHVTTIISSLFLFVFGTGPIKGFAVTLVLGLLVNLFSAVYVSRTIFIWHLNQKGRRPDSLSI